MEQQTSWLWPYGYLAKDASTRRLEDQGPNDRGRYHAGGGGGAGQATQQAHFLGGKSLGPSKSPK